MPAPLHEETLSEYQQNCILGGMSAPCTLTARDHELVYWESAGTAEVDFQIVKDDHLIPVECKAGNHVKAQSLK